MKKIHNANNPMKGEEKSMSEHFHSPRHVHNVEDGKVRMQRSRNDMVKDVVKMCGPREGNG